MADAAEEEEVTDADRRDGLLRSIDQAQRSCSSASVRLVDGPIDNSVASALNDLLKNDLHDRQWDVSILCCSVFVSDRHAVPSTSIVRNAFSGKISSIHVMNTTPNDERILPCIFDPSSFENSKLLTSLLLRNCAVSAPVAGLMRRFLRYAVNLDQLGLTAVSFSGSGGFSGLVEALFSHSWTPDTQAAPTNVSRSRSRRKSLIKRVPCIRKLSFSRRGQARTVPEPPTSSQFSPQTARRKLLYRCPSVLKFTYCNIDNDQAQRIVDVLSQNTTGLRDLDLSDNHVDTVPDVSALRDLTAFALSGLSSATAASTKPISVPSLIDCLQEAKGLVSLNLSFNPLTDECIVALFDWLERTDRLRQLDLASVSLGLVGSQRILTYLRKNRGLQHLSLHGNALDESFSQESAEILRTVNTTMIRLRTEFADWIRPYGIRNWSGRRLLVASSEPLIGVWPRVLARIHTLDDKLVFNEFLPKSQNNSLRADATYHLLRHGSLLLHRNVTAAL